MSFEDNFSSVGSCSSTFMGDNAHVQLQIDGSDPCTGLGGLLVDDCTLIQEKEAETQKHVENVEVQENIRPYIGMKFQSVDEAYNFYNMYSGNKGFHIRRHSSCRSRKGVCSAVFVCSKAGFSKRQIQEKKNLDSSSNLKTTENVEGLSRTGCKAYLRVKLVKKEGLYQVSVFHDDHNHGLDPNMPSKKRNLRSKKRLTSTQKEDEEAEKQKHIKNVEVQEIVRPYVGMEFQSLDDAYKLYNIYGGGTGFRIRRQSRSTSRKGVSSVRFVCSKEGFSKRQILEKKELDSSSNLKIVENGKGFSRTGCKVYLRVKSVKGDLWQVSVFHDDHNHQLALNTPSEKCLTLIQEEAEEQNCIENVEIQENVQEEENGVEDHYRVENVEVQEKEDEEAEEQNHVENVGVHEEEDEEAEEQNYVKNVDVCEEEDEEAEEHNHVENARPYVGMEFQSLDDVYNFYNMYGGNTGFHIRRQSRSTSKKGVSSVKFVCSKEGFSKRQIQQKEGLGGSSDLKTSEKERGFSRTGCKAYLRVKLAKADLWQVSVFHDNHNHELSPNMPSKKRSFQSKKCLTNTDVKRPINENSRDAGNSKALQMFRVAALKTKLTHLVELASKDARAFSMLEDKMSELLSQIMPLASENSSQQPELPVVVEDESPEQSLELHDFPQLQCKGGKKRRVI